MAEVQGTLFDERFLERYAGAIISDPEIAIVELVANAWPNFCDCRLFAEGPIEDGNIFDVHAPGGRAIPRWGP